MTELPRWLDDLLAHLGQSSILAIALTIAAFLAGTWIFRRLKHPIWCPPVLISAMLTAAVLAILAIDFVDYRRGAEWVSILLGPATVALGVPLYQQIHHIRALWLPILATVPLAATLACIYAVALAWWMGGTPEVLLSLAPKSVTAPIAMGITEHIGGSLSLMMGGLLVTGVVATLFVSLLAPLLGVTDDRIIGFVLGVNGHAIGTVHAFTISPLAGAFSSLGMGLTGIFTALCLPFAAELFK
ncbi:LrgB family protein [Allohahella marinimesophila]|uniref:LrgB family protein n=1 Tax=Allohahella marinimesophila TaxID=1054972 RepID=A0ABP7NIR4_9GAMM